MTDSTTKPPFQFPQFNMPGFPYASLPQQLAASFTPPDQQFSNASQYGRWNGVNNNAFGLFPNQLPPLFGSPASAPGMAFQPPWANNGYLGSNQGPGSNPGMAPPPPTPQQPSQPPMPTGAPGMGGAPLPGAVAGPGGTYPMPMSPNFIDPTKQPVGGITPNAPNYFLNPNAINSVGPGGFTPSAPGSNVTPLPPPSSVTPLGGGALNKTPLDGNNKMAGGPATGLLAPEAQNFGASPPIPGGAGSNQAFSSNFMPTGATSTSAALQHLLASGRGGAFAQGLGLNALPQSFTPGQFNQVAQQNPVLAEQMAAQGGQQYRNAIMAQNGWNQNTMNQFLNANGSGPLPGFGPEQLAQLRALGIG